MKYSTKTAKAAQKKQSGKKKRPAKKPAVHLIPGTSIKILAGLVPLLVPITAVQPDPANPRRTKTLLTLVANFKRFGVRKPIVVNERDKMIEAGHQTRAALLELGASEIPVVWADDERIDAAGYNIADNRAQEVTAEWDEAPLARLLKELKEEEGGTEGVGFEGKEIDRLIAEFASEEVPDGGEGGEGGGSDPPPDREFKVIIDCRDEDQQTELIERFAEEDLTCRALVL